MIQFSDGYNAQTIFDQVWEAPYEWFGLSTTKYELPELGMVYEMTSPTSWKAKGTVVTVDMIEKAVIDLYVQVISKRTGRNWEKNMSDWLADFDADDVDAILQWAVFGELRYG